MDLMVNGGHGVGQGRLEEKIVSNTRIRREEKQVTYRMVENEIKIDIELLRKEHWQLL